MITNSSNKGININNENDGGSRVLTFSKVFGHEKKDIDKEKTKHLLEKQKDKKKDSSWIVFD